MPLIEDWLNCPGCGYNGWPKFSVETATAFVCALEREASALIRAGEFERARRRYVRALAIFTDYSPALIGMAGTLIDEARLRLGDAELWPMADELRVAARVLIYACRRGEPPMDYSTFLLGWLMARMGNWEVAHGLLTWYTNRDRSGNGRSPFPDEPRDATEQARALLIDLPNRWARRMWGPGILGQSGSWGLTPWRPEVDAA